MIEVGTEIEMKLASALFNSPEILVYQIELDEEWDYGDYHDWNVAPITSATLAPEHTREGVLDGEFILKAQLISPGGVSEFCYLGITFPEAIVNYSYFLEGTNVLQKRGRRWPEREVISSVVIEKYVDYEIFYSKIDPEAGLRILRNGLSLATTKWPIAHALARILRDEKQYEEAVEMLGIVLAEGPPDLRYTNYLERSRLLELLGQHELAQLDKIEAESLSNAKD